MADCDLEKNVLPTESAADIRALQIDEPLGVHPAANQKWSIANKTITGLAIVAFASVAIFAGDQQGHRGQAFPAPCADGFTPEATNGVVRCCRKALSSASSRRLMKNEQRECMNGPAGQPLRIDASAAKDQDVPNPFLRSGGGEKEHVMEEKVDDDDEEDWNSRAVDEDTTDTRKDTQRPLEQTMKTSSQVSQDWIENQRQMAKNMRQMLTPAAATPADVLGENAPDQRSRKVENLTMTDQERLQIEKDKLKASMRPPPRRSKEARQEARRKNDNVVKSMLQMYSKAVPKSTVKRPEPPMRYPSSVPMEGKDERRSEIQALILKDALRQRVRKAEYEAQEKWIKRGHQQ